MSTARQALLITILCLPTLAAGQTCPDIISCNYQGTGFSAINSSTATGASAASFTSFSDYPAVWISNTYGPSSQGLIVSASTNGVVSLVTAGTAVSGLGAPGIAGFGLNSGGNGIEGTASHNGNGVQGICGASGASGLYGQHTGAGYGVAGRVTASTGIAGVYGDAPATSYAGYFHGNLTTTGTLSKAAGSFLIDHPTDPMNKYLVHSFVESPDMKNIYDGVVILDKLGEGRITLPIWFEALNTEFRYQLTCIGTFAPVYVKEEIRRNEFIVAGGRPGLRVSWQVTGVRRDAYAEKYRLPIEYDKPPGERGRYLHPEAFGKSEEQGMGGAPIAPMPRGTLNNSSRAVTSTEGGAPSAAAPTCMGRNCVPSLILRP